MHKNSSSLQIDNLTHSSASTSILVMHDENHAERLQYGGKPPTVFGESNNRSIAACKSLKNASMRSHDAGSDRIRPHLCTVRPLCLALRQAITISHRRHLKPSSLTQLNSKQRIDSLRYGTASVVLRIRNREKPGRCSSAEGAT